MNYDLDEALESYSNLRQQLVEIVKVHKHVNKIPQYKMAEHIGRSPSAISDLLNPGGDVYKWSYNDIAEAINKLMTMEVPK